VPQFGHRHAGRHVVEADAGPPDERLFATVVTMGVEERFEGLRRSAAGAPLSRDSVTELLGITATLIDERKRIRRLLRQLPENFAEVRKLLNELARTVR
jgi:hypothetical protein